MSKTKKRLDPDEVEQARNRILKEYDHLIVRFMKPQSLKNAFLDRYLEAMKNRFDMAHFLHAELSAVQELFEKESGKEAEFRRIKQERAEKRKIPSSGFAEKILEENRMRIEKYPDLDFHPDAATEIRKMAGVMRNIDEEYWPAVDDILRKYSTTLYSNSRLALEKSIYELATARVGSASNRLSVYMTILGRFPRDYRSLEREGQLYLLNCAHFLHIFLVELEKILDSNNIGDDERVFMEKAANYVHTVIVDFRLVDLKPK